LLKSNIKNGAGSGGYQPISCRKPSSRGATMKKLQRIIILVWAVVLGAIAMSVVAAGLLLGTRKGAGR
jgi:hypothetical protein